MEKLKSMAMFVRVAETGSFSAAARQAGIARSIVTRYIAALEKSLQVKLITRSTRSLALTAAGSAYLERCRQILDLVESAETEIAQERESVRGVVRLSLPLSYGVRRLAPLLLEFSRDYPAVQLDMHYTDKRVDLVEEGVDLALRITRRLADSEVVRRIGAVRLVAAAAPAYLARHGRPEHPDELVSHDCLSYTVDGKFDTWSFLVDGAMVDFPVRVRLYANNGDVLNQAAVAGLGIICQPDFIVTKSIQAGQLEPLFSRYPAPERSVYVVLPGNRQIPYRVRVLIDFLAERLRHDDDDGLIDDPI